MDYYLLQNHWSSLVRNFKDSEKTYEQEAYDSERLCMDVVDYIRYTRIRQYKLFQQKRGEDFERMVQTLESREHSPESLKRFLDNDELWATTLEFAEQ
jgi:hypothetical protein